MTITLTSKELGDFQASLRGWFDRQLEYVLKNLGMDYRSTLSGSTFEQVGALRDRFEKENPKPDWRTLL
jgi:hypothetical protein